jgi:hypothetical protein
VRSASPWAVATRLEPAEGASYPRAGRGGNASGAAEVGVGPDRIYFTDSVALPAGAHVCPPPLSSADSKNASCLPPDQGSVHRVAANVGHEACPMPVCDPGAARPGRRNAVAFRPRVWPFPAVSVRPNCRAVAPVPRDRLLNTLWGPVPPPPGGVRRGGLPLARRQKRTPRCIEARPRDPASLKARPRRGRAFRPAPGRARRCPARQLTWGGRCQAEEASPTATRVRADKAGDSAQDGSR